MIALDSGTVQDATSWASIAAGLAVAAEQVQDRDGEAAGRLEALAARCRNEVRDVVTDGLAAAYPDWSLIQIDTTQRRLAGQVMRDAYTSARAGGAA